MFDSIKRCKEKWFPLHRQLVNFKRDSTKTCDVDSLHLSEVKVANGSPGHPPRPWLTKMN